MGIIKGDEQLKNLGMTTMEVKTYNKNKVYNFIYTQKTTCKLEIAKELEMGLSTVNQNLKLLEEEGYIHKNGFFDSTGGRKADAIEILKQIRISIGVAILKESIDIVALDLYGEIIQGQTFSIVYEHTDNYYLTVGNLINQFITDHELTHILGVSIAIQGVVSSDGTAVSYGKILNNDEMTLENFSKHIPYPCRMEHDSKAAAALEIWNNPTLEDGIVLLLNRNMGGAIIHQRKVQHGNHMRCGLFEHFILVPNGNPCYCGQNGCFEAYCSANALKQKTKMEIGRFFDLLIQKDVESQRIWTDYLDHLAHAIQILYTLLDGKIIISGYLAWFFKDQDIAYIIHQVNKNNAFPLDESDIILSKHGSYTQAIGTALSYIEDFLNTI